MLAMAQPDLSSLDARRVRGTGHSDNRHATHVRIESQRAVPYALAAPGLAA